MRQDPDTLDTWFSSALWPFSTLGWPEKTEDLDYFYPNDVLVTGYDIIFFWVIRMIFSGYEQMGKAPFHTVLFHGLVRDSQGRKMSKSLGNGIDPLEVKPSLTLMILVARFFMRLKGNRLVEGAMRGMRPVVIGMIAAAALLLIFPHGDNPDDRNFIDAWSWALFGGVFVGSWRKVNPILLIVLSAGAGILIYYVF